MGKRSFRIEAPDGKMTFVNFKKFNRELDADKFKRFINKRFHLKRYDEDLKMWIVSYYRDTRRNREMFGFSEYIPDFTPPEEYWR